MENVSNEFSKATIEKMINEKAEADWQFVFLSADLDAIGEARDLGVHRHSSKHFIRSGEGSQRVWASLSDTVSDYRSLRRDRIAFDEEDGK